MKVGDAVRPRPASLLRVGTAFPDQIDSLLAPLSDKQFAVDLNRFDRPF